MSEHTSAPTDSKDKSSVESNTQPSSFKVALQEIKSNLVELLNNIQIFLKGGPKNIAKIPLIILMLPVTLIQKYLRYGLYHKIIIFGFLLGLYFIAFSTKKIIKLQHKTQPVHEAHDYEKEKLEKQIQFNAELKHVISRTIIVERFTAHLRGNDGNLKEFDMELFITCDSDESKNWLKTQMHAVKEIVSLILGSKNYDEMIQPEGKEDFKEKVKKSIDNYFKKKKTNGFVEKIYFSQMMMES